MCTITALAGLLTALIQNELFFDETPTHPRYDPTSTTHALSALQTVTTVILCNFTSLPSSYHYRSNLHYETLYFVLQLYEGEEKDPQRE